MKWINLRLYLEVLGRFALRRALAGVLNIWRSITFWIREKILLQKDLIQGHSHQMWAVDPVSWHPRKHRGSVVGYILASLAGVRYQLVITLRLDSISEIFLMPLRCRSPKWPYMGFCKTDGQVTDI